MDISVSRLNRRMALQLPAEFPLGLVFVVGKVRNFIVADDESGLPAFDLTENDHTIHCHLSERASQDTTISEGDMIRAGGHLVFDSYQANYFLKARDVEVLPEHRPSRTTLAPMFADIKRRAQVASLVPAELPDWVQKIAPLEFRSGEADLATAETYTNGRSSMLPQIDGLDTIIEPARSFSNGEQTLQLTASEDQPTLPRGLTNDLVTFLSEAMDSSEDVELTQDIVADLAPDAQEENIPTAETAEFSRLSQRMNQPVAEETVIPWFVVLIVVTLLLTFLSFLVLLAIIAAR